MSILFKNGHQELSNIEIQNNKSYLIMIEFFKNEEGLENLKLIINNKEERKFIVLGAVDSSQKVIIFE